MKSKIIYKFFNICLAAIFFLYLGGSNSWAYDYNYNYAYNYNYDYDYNFPLPYIYGSYIYGSDPNVMITTTGSDGIVPTLLEYSVEKIIVWFFSYPYPMDPDATKNAFHFYEDGNNDITGNGELDLDNTGDYPTLTFTPSSSLQEGVDYKVRIDYTAQDTTGRTIDGNRNGAIEEGELDNWEMMFKFDIDEGFRWSQIYNPDNIFSENIVSAMVVDNQDGLWVGSKEGDICYFDGNDWNCEKPFESIIYSIDDIPCMVVDNEGVLWTGLNIEYPQDDPNTPMLAKLENKTPHIISAKNLNNISSDELIKDIAVDSQNNIWIATSKSGVIKYYDDHVIEQFTIKCAEEGDENELSNDFIISLLVDHADVVWIGTAFSGMWKLKIENDGSYAYEKQVSPLDVLSINAMSSDPSGNIWVGTNNGLLLKLNPSVSGGEPIWFEYTSANGLAWDCVNTLRIDPNNAFIWVGTSDVLAKFDIVKESWSTYFEQTLGEDINHLAINTRGEVWFDRAQGIQMRDEILPYVLESESFPLDEAVIDTAQDIRIVFSEPMNHEKTESAFSIIKVEDNQSIMGELFWQDSQTLVFVPDSMGGNQSYLVEIDTPAEDVLGNHLSKSYQVVFSIAEQPKKDPHYSRNYFLYPHNSLYPYNNIYPYNNMYQSPVNYQQHSPLQLYNIYSTPINYQNQLAMQQWPSWNFSSPFDQFCTSVLQTWYQKLLLTRPHPFNRQAHMFTNSQLQPYTYTYTSTSPNFLLQSFYQPQYQSWNSTSRQGQSFENYQVKSIAIQSKQSLPTISQKHQPQSQGSQLNQQSYKPPITQSTTLHQPQYQKNQTWNLKESQQQQTLNLQKQQQLMNVQQQKSWTQTFQPYYR